MIANENELDYRERALVQALREGANITVNFHLDTEQEAFDKSHEYKHLKAAHVQREEAGETKWLGLENDKQLEFSFFYGKDGE